MTIIAGAWDEETNVVYLASDSLVTEDENGACHTGVQKLYSALGFGFAFAGDITATQTFWRQVRKSKKSPESQEDFEDWVHKLVSHVLDNSPSKDGDDFNILIATQWGIANVYSDGSLLWMKEAVGGSGGDIARGSFFASKNLPLTTEERVLQAVLAACEHNVHCRPPIQTLRVPSA